MTLYILHYASIGEEGALSIDCQGPFKSLEEARQQQSNLLLAFQSEHPHFSNPIEESCGTFHRIAYTGHLSEIQTHIKEIETWPPAHHMGCHSQHQHR